MKKKPKKFLIPINIIIFDIYTQCCCQGVYMSKLQKKLKSEQTERERDVYTVILSLLSNCETFIVNSFACYSF